MDHCEKDSRVWLLISDGKRGGNENGGRTHNGAVGVGGIKAKVKACVYSPDIPVFSADFRLITTRYWNSLFHCLLPGENAAHFLQL